MRHSGVYKNKKHLFVKYVEQVSTHLQAIKTQVPTRPPSNFQHHIDIFMASLTGLDAGQLCRKFDCDINHINRSRERAAQFAVGTVVKGTQLRYF